MKKFKNSKIHYYRRRIAHTLARTNILLVDNEIPHIKDVYQNGVDHHNDFYEIYFIVPGHVNWPELPTSDETVMHGI